MASFGKAELHYDGVLLSVYNKNDNSGKENGPFPLSQGYHTYS